VRCRVPSILLQAADFIPDANIKLEQSVSRKNPNWLN
jgi:hypothetical protein